jgi:hypothetical protein
LYFVTKKVVSVFVHFFIDERLPYIRSTSNTVSIGRGAVGTTVFRFWLRRALRP